MDVHIEMTYDLEYLTACAKRQQIYLKEKQNLSKNKFNENITSSLVIKMIICRVCAFIWHWSLLEEYSSSSSNLGESNSIRDIENRTKNQIITKYNARQICISNLWSIEMKKIY